MNPRLSVLLAGALALAPAAALAQTPSASVRMSADRTEVDVGEIFRLEIRADLEGTNQAAVEPPDLSAFDIVGRQVSTPMSFSFGWGGGQQQVRATTVHVYNLRAREPGLVSLAPAKVRLGNERFESDPLEIRVRGGGSAVGPQPNVDVPGPSSPAAGLESAPFDPNCFLRAVVDRSEPYAGQQTTYTLYLYTRRPLRGPPSITQEPTADGFWVHDLLEPSRTLEPHRYAYRGIEFHVYLLRRHALFPLREGRASIGAASVTLSGRFDIFRPPSAPDVCAGAPLEVQVRGLPEAERPSGMPVHVGELELEAELDRGQVATGDAVTLTLTARGHGQLRELRFRDPDLAALRVLEPEIADDVTARGDRVGGTRTFRYLIIPEREGRFTLPAFRVAVFDPNAETWRTERADVPPLSAAGLAPTAAEPAPSTGPAPPAEAELEERFGPIRTRSELSREHRPLAREPWLPAALAAPPAIFVLLLLGIPLLRRLRPEESARAARRARRRGARLLGAAERHAAQGEAGPFYAAIAQAIKQGLELALGTPVGGLTHAELAHLLAERGMDTELARSIVDELEGADFARFSAMGSSGTEMEACLGRGRKLLRDIERFRPRGEEEA